MEPTDGGTCLFRGRSCARRPDADPPQSSTIDVCVDRGCFQYVMEQDRVGYATELRRVLRPGGKLLPKASLHAAGVRNDIDEHVIRDTFYSWWIERMERAQIPSDTRTLDVLLVRVVR
jgi:Methyltransferase domain